MNSIYSCTIVEHDNEPIVGFCLNMLCETGPQCCCQCFLENHETHRKDCKRFGQVSSMICSNLNFLEEKEKKISHSFQQIQNLYQISIKQLKGEHNLLNGLLLHLKEGHFYELKGNLGYLKQWNLLTQNSENKNNNAIMNKLGKLGQILTNSNNMIEKLQDIIDSFIIQPQEEIIKIQQLISKEQLIEHYIAGNQDIIMLGMDAINSGKPVEALKYFDLAIKSNTDKLEEVYLQKGLLLTDLKRFEEAIQSFNDSLKIKSNQTLAYNSKGIDIQNLGNALCKLKLFDDAIKSYDDSLKLDSKQSIILNNKGLALIENEEYEEAVKCYDEALKVNNNYSFAHINKGLALQKLNKFAVASNCFDEALRINPNCQDAYNYKGLALISLNNYSDALICFDKAIMIAHYNPVYYKNKGDTLKAMGRSQEAIKNYNLALQKGYSDEQQIQNLIQSISNS